MSGLKAGPPKTARPIDRPSHPQRVPSIDRPINCASHQPHIAKSANGKTASQKIRPQKQKSHRRCGSGGGNL